VHSPTGNGDEQWCGHPSESSGDESRWVTHCYPLRGDYSSRMDLYHAENCNRPDPVYVA